MEELKGAILSQHHRRNQGGGSGVPGPLNQNDTNLTKKSLVSSFSLSFSIFAYNSTHAQ